VAWQGLVGELSTVPGLLMKADRGILELAARVEVQHRAAAAVVRDQGSTLIVRDAEGAVRFAQARPEAGLMVKFGAQLKALYEALGLSPAGRSRLSLPRDPAPSGRWDVLRAVDPFSRRAKLK
jgi:P27 family predicted phage terminase small subunit